MHKNKNTILIINSDPQLQKLMSIVLDPVEFKIIECRLGKQATRTCISTKPDLVLLDIALSDMDGKEIIASIREISQVPIIILTSRNEDEDIVFSLNAGANDYVTRPFSSDVLMARIKAALRKAAVDETGVSEISNGPLRIDLVRHEVYVNNELLGFTPKEYNLLRYFIVHCGKMLTHKEILKEIWGQAHGDDTQYLRVFVGQLRAKIETKTSLPKLIITEPGIGYRMEIVKSDHSPN